MLKVSTLLPFLCLLARPALAEPGFAAPPGAPLAPEPAPAPRDTAPREREREPEPEFFAPSSALRLSVGPGLRVAEAATDGGLAAAVDIGSGAVGARASGVWMRAGSDQGLSEYGADLWIDFGAEHRLHPIVGAGAAVARLNHTAPDGSREAWSYGAGTLRGTLEYVLPVERADARAGIDAIGSVPAIQAHDAPSASPWLVFTARVAIGF